jgi:molybdopterin-containing oxidoreductase family iron-sulfur binding subunit
MTEVAKKPAEGVPEKGLSRRDFLKKGGAAVVLSTAGLVTASRVFAEPTEESVVSTGVKYAMVIDLDRCHGCRACMEACKIENNTPEGVFWMYVFRFEDGRYPNTRISYMPRPCMHCDNAPCAKPCPVGARYKRVDGLVATDWKRCIGCRYCEVACPYSVNYFNWSDQTKRQYLDWKTPEAEAVRQITNDSVPPYINPDLAGAFKPEGRYIAGGSHIKGVMGKCTFCVHRLEKGLLPACVATCPVHVYSFGNINDPESEVSKVLHSKRAWRLLEELGTLPSVYYVGSVPPTLELRQIEAGRGRTS